MLWPCSAVRVRPGPPCRDGKAEKIIVMKAERALYLVRGGEVMRSYQVALGRQPKGTKLYQGDGRTPEGHLRDLGLQRAEPVPPLLARVLSERARPGGGARPGAVDRRGHHGPRPGAGAAQLRNRALALQLDQRLHRRGRRRDRGDLAAGGDRDADRDPAMIPPGANQRRPARSNRNAGRDWRFPAGPFRCYLRLAIPRVRTRRESMMKKLTILAPAAAVAVGLLALGGCATKGDIESAAVRDRRPALLDRLRSTPRPPGPRPTLAARRCRCRRRRGFGRRCEPEGRPDLPRRPAQVGRCRRGAGCVPAPRRVRRRSAELKAGLDPPAVVPEIGMTSPGRDRSPRCRPLPFAYLVARRQLLPCWRCCVDGAVVAAQARAAAEFRTGDLIGEPTYYHHARRRDAARHRAGAQSRRARDLGRQSRASTLGSQAPRP